MERRSTVRLGLCCSFLEAPIRFRTTTARYVKTLSASTRRAFLREIARHNARALHDAIAWCVAHGVGAFRLGSAFLPLYTHPEVGYSIEDIDEQGDLTGALRAAGARARDGDVRLSFHPDQFVALGSPTPAVVDSALSELEYQARVAGLVGADQLTVHGGGAQGGKSAALARLRASVERLSPRARSLLALENDDRVFTVADLLPICRAAGLRLIYDVHHHRCNPDNLSIEAATDLAAATWGGREPWAHVSSPVEGWGGPAPSRHSAYVDPADFPALWRDRWITVDVEAKAKELAVLRLREGLGLGVLHAP